MASQSMARTEDLAIAAAATLGIHVVLGLGLVIAGWFADHQKPETDDDSEVDIEPPPRQELLPLPRPEPVVIPQVVLPELPKELPPPAPRDPRPDRPPQVVANPDPTPGPEPESADPEGAEDGLPAGDPIQLPDVYVSGDVEVGKGKSGGTGGGGGRGGTGPDPGPAADGPPAVSIAAIKKFAKPIGDVDFLADQHYPDDARRLRIEGEVKVRVQVDDRGKVTGRKLIKKIGHGLDEVAMDLAAKLRFEPALDTNDRPVASIVVWTYRFQLPD